MNAMTSQPSSAAPAAPLAIPGYHEDAQGRLVPEACIRPAELLRDQLVRTLVRHCESVAADLAGIKRSLLDDVSAHIALVAEQYGVAISGEGGAVRLTTYDGRMMIERTSAARIVVGEAIHAAERLIRNILDEIADPAARAIVDRAFRRDRKTGELSAARLIDMANVQLDDERWERATAAIRDSLTVVGTVTYFRAYTRARSDQPWKQVLLDFSAIPPAAAEPNVPDGVNAPSDLGGRP